MSALLFGVVPWILFAALFVVAALVAAAIRATGRKVTRDDILLLITKVIGSIVMAFIMGLVCSVALAAFMRSAPELLVGAICAVVAMAAAALTWKFGKARIR